MTPNPLLGVFFHWLGGFAAASYYVPYRSVRGWSWEVFWLVGGLTYGLTMRYLGIAPAEVHAALQAERQLDAVYRLEPRVPRRRL